MKRIDRYVLKELLIPFLIGTVSVVLMFQANYLIKEFKEFQLQSVPLSAILQIVLYRTPSFLQLTLPVGMSLAASLAVSRLARESELTALRASGTSILRALLPIAVFGVFVSLGSYLLVEKVMPVSERKAKKIEIEAAILGSGPQLRSNVIVKLQNYTASFGTVTGGMDKVIQLNDILLIERPNPETVNLIGAKHGTYQDGVWRLSDCYAWVIVGDQLSDFRPRDDVVINERITVQDFFSPPDANELSSRELSKAIEAGKKTGQDMTRQEITFHTKYSLPASCAVFAFIGPMFAVWLSRSGAFVGVLLSIVIVFLYYNIYIITTEILGNHGMVTPWLAAWLPNFIFVVLGALIVRRLE